MPAEAPTLTQDLPSPTESATVNIFLLQCEGLISTCDEEENGDQMKAIFSEWWRKNQTWGYEDDHTAERKAYNEALRVLLGRPNMIDTPLIAPDVTTADLQRWVNYFYVEIVLRIIEDSGDLWKDWETKIKPKFRTFFLEQEEVREHAGITSFSEDDIANEKRIAEVDRWHRQAEKMLHEKVKTHIDITEMPVVKLMLSIGGGIATIIGSFSARGGDDSTYQNDGFPFANTQNSPGALPKDDKPKGYFGGDDSLLK